MQYLFRLDKGKRFLTLFLFALPACLLLAVFFPVTGYFEWLFDYSGVYTSYGQLWLSLMQRDTFMTGLLIVAYLLLVFSISVITTIVIKSIRIGKFQIKSVFYLINENFFPSLALVTAIILSLLFSHSLICLFLFTWQYIPFETVSYILSMLSFLLIFLLLAFIYSKLVLWLPIMSINGLQPFRAIEAAISKNYPKKRSMFIAYLIPMLLLLFTGILAYLFRTVGIMDVVINVISYTIISVYFCVLSLLAFFEIEGISREDLVKRPYLRR